MKIISDIDEELNAEVGLGYDENLWGLFLEARGGRKGENARNPDYYLALEIILKRLYEMQVKEIRVFRSSLIKPFSDWKIEEREIFIENNNRIKLTNDHLKLRQAICTAQSKFKTDPNTKGGNPTKRIFIYANIENDKWDSLIKNKIKAEVVAEKNTNSESDEKEQEEIITQLTNQKKTKEDILRELLNINTIAESKVQVVNEVYKRDNQTIARIKYLRDFKCQICGTSIQKRNGQLYIEAAHIDPKRLKGKENLENIILLCPNHHKEFDLGDLEILNRSDKALEFKLNGRKYSINLEISTK